MESISTQEIVPITCDVLVIGGGPAGAVAARTLSLKGMNVILLDSINTLRPKVGESLPGAITPMFHSLGLLPWLERSGPIINPGNLSIWGNSKLSETNFIDDPYGCGWHLDRQRFDQCLRDAATDSGVLFFKGRLASISSVPQGIEARTREYTFRSNWVIDASGKSRAAARRLGASRSRGLPLISLYVWGLSSHPDTRSIVEAAQIGWWYTAGLPGGKRVLALHTLPEEAKAILADEEGFLRALLKTRHIRQWISASGLSKDSPEIADASGSHLDDVFGDRWIAVGDAAIAFDPLSSQGLYNAVYTGLRGAQAVNEAAISQSNTSLFRYGERLRSIRYAYESEVIKYYRQEQRWSEFPFWKIHHG